MPTSPRVRYKGCRPTPCYFVGQGPCALPGGKGKESPSHGFAVPAPFRQGGQGDGGTDCHSQCAHWLRNDSFLQGVRYKIGRVVREADPYAPFTDRLS